MSKTNPSSDIATKTFVRNELRIELSNLKNEVDENAKAYRDQILNGLDKVMGELQNIREDNIIGAYQTKQLTKKAGGHEKRIKVLEQTA